MLSDAEYYSQHRVLQTRDTEKFLKSIVKKMDWTRKDYIAMDIGCGTGDSCYKQLLPSFPNIKKVVAIDRLQNMISFAKKHNSHEKIEYHEADISNWDTVKQWESGMSKVISIHCLHWLKNQKDAFENIYKLLIPGGEASLMFTISMPAWDAYQGLKDDQTWNEYLKNVDSCIPESHYKQYGARHYRNMLETIGFNVDICEVEVMQHEFLDDKDCEGHCFPLCSFSAAIPAEKRSNFKKVLLDIVVRYSGRTTDGRPKFHYNVLELLIKKPADAN